MSFSDQWPDRVTHYRIASDSKGEFIIPQKDHFDGNGFYKIKLIEYTKTINKNKNTYKFSGKNYEFAKFDAINGISKIKGKINLNSDSGKFGFMFNVDEDNLGSLNIVFDIDKQEIQFYNTSINNISNLQPQSNIPFEFNEKSSLDFTIIIDDSVVVIYVNDEIVLSSRMFLVQGSEWGIFSIDNDVIFENITLNK